MQAKRSRNKIRRHRCIHYEPLGSEDAGVIARLQRRLFPRELREPVKHIGNILKSTEQHFVCNMSFAVYDGNRPVGYLFGYVENRSMYHDRDEEIVYLKEVGLLPGYEDCLLALFFKLYEQWIAFTPGIALEAHVLDESLDNWKRLKRMFRFFGLSPSHKKGAGGPDEPPYNLFRLDVADYTQALYNRPAAMPQPVAEYENDVSVTVIADPRQWLSLQPVWDDLLRDTDDHNVFQSFDLLWTWWKYCGTWNDLSIVVIRKGDAVIGIVPLMREYFEIYGRIVRKLMFITAPMEMSRPKLIFGHNSDVCLPAFLRFLKDHPERWDIIDIDEQLKGGLARQIREFARNHRWLIADSETMCPKIDLSGTWGEFHAGLSRRMRGNINRLRRRLAAAGEVDVRTTNTWPELDDAIDVHCEIESNSWKVTKNLHLMNDRSAYFYYLGLAEHFGGKREFEQRILYLEGAPIASTFGIRADGVFQSMKIAHDSKYDAYSPGTVLESYELENLFATNVKRYEFMGSFLSNKLRWTSDVVTTQNIHIYQRQPRLALFYFTYFILKRKIVALLHATGQFDRVDRIVKKFRSRPFPRY